MTERVHPSSKPNAITTANQNPKLPPPPMKSQLYNPNRHPYRPNPIGYHRKRRHVFRRCFCLCCFWSILFLILLLLLATISGCVLYLLYHPHRPTFAVASLRILQFNLTTSAADGTTRLTSRLNLTVSAKNPNRKNIAFRYDPFVITCLSSDGTQIANGSYGDSLSSNPNDITILRSSLSSSALLLETETVDQMRSDLKKKSGLPLKILLDTEATIQIESFKSNKIGIRIKCERIHSLIPKAGGGKLSNSSSSSSVAATVSDAKCEVDLRIKIWKWTF